MKKVLPSNVVKNVQYDLKRDPARYVSSTKKICDIMGDSCTVSFLPTRRSNVPCHCKLDTEAVAQIFVPNKQRLEMRKVACDRKRKIYNTLVWKRILKMHIVDKKLRNSGFKFHHEMSTDGVSASLLYSRPTSFYDMRSPTNQQRGVMEANKIYWSGPRKEDHDGRRRDIFEQGEEEV